MIRAHSSSGNPAMPVPTAGTAMLSMSLRRAISKVAIIDALSDVAVVRPPSAMLAAWIT